MSWLCGKNAQHAFAGEPEPVATITKGGVETSYNSLKEACTNAVDGDTIVLIADEETSDTFAIGGKTITIDLNGHLYRNEAAETAAIKINSDADVTIKDSSANGNGKMTGQSILFYVDVQINDQDNWPMGKLTLQKGTYTCEGTEYKSEYAVIYNRGITTINGGSIINEGVNSTICSSRNSRYGVEHRAELTIKDATVQSTNAYAINTYGDTKLDDVNIITNAPKPEGSGTYFALICAGGYTEINGNTTIKAENAGIGALGIYGSQVTVKGGLIDGDVTTGDSPDITVEGGEFTGESLWSSWYATIRASGGFFKYDPVKDHIQEGYKYTDNIDGPVGYRYAVMPDSYCVVKYDTNGGNAIDLVVFSPH